MKELNLPIFKVPKINITVNSDVRMLHSQESHCIIVFHFWILVKEDNVIKKWRMSKIQIAGNKKVFINVFWKYYVKVILSSNRVICREYMITFLVASRFAEQLNEYCCLSVWVSVCLSVWSLTSSFSVMQESKGL